ncbi:MAG: PDZ domain-containing protein [Myxococcota bacterium]
MRTTESRWPHPAARSVVPRVAVAAWLLFACTPEELGCEPKVAEDAGVVEEPRVRVEARPAVPRGDGPVHEYTLRFADAARHMVDVEAVLATDGPELELMMAVWTPGSYLVREFARQVEGFEAMTLEGTPLPVRKVSKNRWRVMAPPAAPEEPSPEDQAAAADAPGGEGEAPEAAPAPVPAALPERIAIRYRVYARELTVRTNFVDADLAVLNGAALYVVPAEGLASPFDVRMEVPNAWPHVATALPVHPEAAEGETRYFAMDFDELVDSPWVAGAEAQIDTFEVGGVEHVLATFEGHGVFDQERALADLTRLVARQQRFWRVVPNERYVFQNVLSGGGGGLEHKASTLFIGSRWASEDDDAYRRWLGLVSHEFFHTWNVKRLRPEPLGPFDYETENYVRDLWVAEGVTSYYDDLLLRRIGLMTQTDYLEVLSKSIERVESAPGRLVQSLSMASFDAWIKYYRPDENSVNTAVSYYVKGMLVAFLLDARIREATDGERSLDDVMRAAYERFSAEPRGFTPEAFRDLASELSGVDHTAFFAEAVDGAAPLDFTVAFRTLGLRFAPAEEAPAGAYLGARLGEGGRVTEVRRDTPAHAAGLNVGDELIAIGDARIPDDLAGRLESMDAGTETTLLVARRGRLKPLPCTLGARPIERRVEVDPEAGPAPGRARGAGLGPQSGGATRAPRAGGPRCLR